MTPTRSIPLLLAASLLAVLAAVTVHASLNKWQWDLLERARHVHRHGTQNADDLSLYFAERMVTWDFLGYPFFRNHPSITTARSWRSAGPFAIPTRWLQPGNIPRLATYALAALIISIVGATIAAACTVRRSTAQLPPPLRTLPEARTAFRDAVFNSVFLTLALTPLLSAAAWYICFDRAQTRAFVADTFEPGTPEWLTLGILLLITAAIIAFRRTPRIVRARLPAAVLGATCPHCGYPAPHAHATRCPECGTDLNTPRRKRSTFWRSALVCSTLGIAITIAALAVNPPPSLIRSSLRWPRKLGRAAQWITLRGEYVVWRPRGTFTPQEVVTITWDDRILHFAVLSVDLMPDPAGITFGNPGFALVWIEEDLNNFALHASQPNIRMAGIADPYNGPQGQIQATGLTVRTSGTPAVHYNLVTFDLSRRIQSFSRTPFDQASPEQRRRLIDPLLESIKERSAKIFPNPPIDED